MTRSTPPRACTVILPMSSDQSNDHQLFATSPDGLIATDQETLSMQPKVAMTVPIINMPTITEMRDKNVMQHEHTRGPAPNHKQKRKREAQRFA